MSGQIIQMPPGDQAWPEVPEHHALGEVGRDHLEPGQAVLVKCIDGYWEFMIDQSEFTCHDFPNSHILLQKFILQGEIF